MIIDIKELSFERQDSIILEHINWQVTKGENWCILGLNGSGKTSLLNIINGYQWPTSGTISVLGHQFGTYDLRELRKEIGWVSSSLQTKLYEGDTVLNIVLSGKHSTIGNYDEVLDEDVEQAHQLIQKLGLDHVTKKSYRVLSQGERQKVLIARALMNKPKLLILDEPCTGLDFISRHDLLASIETMASTFDVTLIYVTHHIDEIRSYLSKTLLLKNGTIFRKGNTELLMTTEMLSDFFERPVRVTKENDNYWLTMNK